MAKRKVAQRNAVRGKLNKSASEKMVLFIAAVIAIIGFAFIYNGMKTSAENASMTDIIDYEELGLPNN